MDILNYNKNYKVYLILLMLCVLTLGIYCTHLSISNVSIKKNIAELNNQIENMHRIYVYNTENMRKVYVYNIDEMVKHADFLTKKQQFEKDVEKLNNEVNQAQKKIKSLKDANIKTEFSDGYLNSLRLKRDNLVEDYDKYLQTMLTKINKALEEVAIEKNATTIFASKAIVVNTKNVIDVTPEIIKKLEKPSTDI